MPTLLRHATQKPPNGVLKLDIGHPLAQGLSGAWLMNDIGSAIVQDYIRGKHATRSSSGAAWSSDSTGPGVAVTAGGILTTTYTGSPTNFSCVLGFMQPGGQGAGTYPRLVDKNYAGGFFISQHSTGSGGIHSGVEEAGFPYGIEILLADNVPHQAASIRSGSTHYLWGDGGSVQASNTVSTTALDTTAMTFGGAGITQWVGTLEYVYFWERALSLNEVQQLYAEPYAMFQTRPLQKWWSLFAPGGAAAALPPGLGPEVGMIQPMMAPPW